MRKSLTSALLASSLCVAVLPASGQEARPLPVQSVSSYVDFVTVLPGERFPLQAEGFDGHSIESTWSASAGKVSRGVWQAPTSPGAYKLEGTARLGGQPLDRTLWMVVTVPISRVLNGRLNGYPIGVYPRNYSKIPQTASRGQRPVDPLPPGFIELTPAICDVPVSAHYTVGDFQGKDEPVAGRKYLFIQPKVVEKLERLIGTLKGAGYSVDKLQLMSAYRSPELNAEIGNLTTLSRHTYGDAVDILASDFNHDGRVNKKDGEILFWAVNKLDHETDLTGGASLYAPTSAHGYFVHTDTRGWPARW